MIERIAVDGGELAIVRKGRGAERGLVIVVHGFPDHPGTWMGVIDGLAARGFDVVAPWLRGYAPSTTTGPFDVDQLGRDVLALATLGEGRKVIVVGHDWGAIATYAALGADHGSIAGAVTMAVPYPVAFLGALRRDGQWRRSWYMGLFQLPGAEWAARARDFALIDRLWRVWSPGYRMGEVAKAELHACLAASWPAPLMHYRAIVRPVREARDRVKRAAAQSIVTPVLYLHGAEDGCISVGAGRGQERWLRQLQSEVVDGAGHFLHVEVPELVIERVDGFFAYCTR